MLVYATADDLTAWTKVPAPDNADALLRSASGLVRHATRRALYTTTPAGLPVDDDLREALRDATCEQARVWAALGLDPTLGPAAVPGTAKSASLGSAKIDTSREGQDQDRLASLRTLSSTALYLLAGAGLLTGQPLTR